MLLEFGQVQFHLVPLAGIGSNGKKGMTPKVHTVESKHQPTHQLCPVLKLQVVPDSAIPAKSIRQTQIQ